MSSDPRVHARGQGLRSKSRSPFKCVVYNVNVSSFTPYLKNNHTNVFLFISCFIAWHHVLGTISRGGATGQNIGYLYNINSVSIMNNFL